MISLVYQNKKILQEIKKDFKKNNILKLESFFAKSFYETLKEDCESLKYKHKKKAEKFSYSRASEESKVKSLLNSKEFQDFVSSVADKKISSLEIKKFAHKDYAFLQESQQNSSETKLFIFICEKWEPDLGGNFIFTKENGQTFYLTPMENSIAIINKQKNSREFVQYINHSSNQRKIIVIESDLI